MADGKGFEVARAYVTIVPSMQGSQKTITQELTGVTESASVEAGEKSGKKLGESLSKGLKTSAKVIGAAMAAVSAAAIASSKAFVNAAKETASYGDTVDKQSQKVGLSAKKWQEYDYVMKIAGTDMASMTAGFKTLTNQVDAAKKGNEAAIANFKALGISVKSLKNMSREQIFDKVISQLQKMPESSKRAALANKVLGKSGQELAPLFNMTAKETQALIDKANDLGIVMSDSAVKASATFTDSLTTLSSTMQGVKNNIMTQFMPSLTALANGFAESISGNGSTKLTEGISLLLGELQRVMPEVLKTVSEVGITVIQGLAPLLPSLVSTIFSLLTQAIVTISGMMPQLMPAIISGIQGALAAVLEALPIIVEGLTQLVMSIVTWLSSGDNVQNFVNGIVSLAAQITNSIAEVLPVLLPAIVTVISELAKALTEPDNVQLLLDAVLTVIGAIAVAIIKSVPKIIDLVKGVIKNLSELLSRFLEWAVPLAAKGIEGIVNTVKTWGSNLINGIKTWFSDVLSKIGTFVGDIVGKIKELPSKALEIGKNLIVGLWNGINDKINWVKSKIKSMGESITKAIKKVFGVASPSKVFAEIGGFLADGLAIGYEKEMNSVRNDMLNASDGLSANMTTSITANATGANLAGSTTNYNGGAVTINVYGAEGQNINDLAQQIAYKLETMTARKGAVYA